MVPTSYPPQQIKKDEVIIAQRALGLSKARQEKTADVFAASSGSAVTKQFAQAVTKSNRLMAEDILRESGYLLPQSDEVRELLEAMLETAEPGFPEDAAEFLLENLQRTS